MGKIIHLDCDTTLDIPADRVINGAVGRLQTVIIIGIDNQGEPYHASSVADKQEMLWIIEMFKMNLLNPTSY